MIVYQATKKEFLDDVFHNVIETRIHNAYMHHLGRRTSPSEIASWRNSMQFMNTLLIRSSVPDNAGVSIEFQIPLTSKRIDFILTGHDIDHREQVVIIELKQWQSAKLTKKDGVVQTYFQGGEHETAHPSYQAWSYAQLMSNYSETIEKDAIQLNPCAYLHNYEPDSVIRNSFYAEYLEKAPAFLKNDAEILKEFIEQYIRYGDNRDILYKIENGRLRPSKQLADSLSSMLQGNQEFVMIDDQKLVYETALELAAKATIGKKKVLIVEGGPGTGKSVVAINLLVELTNRQLLSQYVSKNAAPRAVYVKLLSSTHRKTIINNLFSGSGAYINSKPNQFDALIIDEAHRLNFKSGLYQNQGDNQAKEIMSAAKFSVFFVDDNQRIHFKDIGNKKQLERWARELDADVVNLKLESQFRCNGSDGYLAWLDNSLQIRETANIQLNQSEYDFRIFSDPNELRNAIEKKNKINNKSRLVAGYCWDWKSKKNPSQNDIVIPEYNFAMQWNLSDDGSTWIIAPDSVNQVGCIHTCQGLELDYIGVIVGEDLRLQGDNVTTDISKRSSGDNSIKGLKKLIAEDPAKGKKIADEIIRNTYRTLMTRGIKGCYVYFCDPKLAAYFESRIKSDLIQESIDPEMLVELIPRIEPIVNDDVKYIDYLPLYTIRAACGAFSEYQQVEELGWVKATGMGRLNNKMFVVQASGHSMEPLINDEDFCVFQAYPMGSRNCKIVLVQHSSHYDQENQGCYSIKKYSSEKKYDPETGEWQHEIIRLKPINPDYEDIIIDHEDGYAVVGEFVGVIKENMLPD